MSFSYRIGDDCLRLFQNALKMVRTSEALRINLVDVLGPGRTRREPSVCCYNFQSSEGSAIPRCVGENSLDLFPGELFQPDLIRREPFKHLLLLRGGRSFDARVFRLSKVTCQLQMDLAGIASHPCSDLRGE